MDSITLKNLIVNGDVNIDVNINIAATHAKTPIYDKSIEKWTEKKQNSKKIAEKLRKIGKNNRAFRMEHCSDMTEFYICPCCGQKKIKRTNFCRDRLCPICNWHLSKKRYNEMVKTFECIDNTEDYDFYFLTLTLKNCEGKKLDETIKAMQEAWRKITKRRAMQRAIKGTARSLEITYNNEAHTFHPHYHIIIAIDKNQNISKSDFQWLWDEAEQSTGTYRHIIDFKPIHAKKEAEYQSMQEKIYGAVLETFKYAVKDKQTSEMPINDFKWLVRAINGKRLVMFSGIFKNARIKAGLTGEEAELENEAVNEVPKCNKCINQTMHEAIMQWSFEDNTYYFYEKELANEIKSNDEL